MLPSGRSNVSSNPMRVSIPRRTASCSKRPGRFALAVLQPREPLTPPRSSTAWMASTSGSASLRPYADRFDHHPEHPRSEPAVHQQFGILDSPDSSLDPNRRGQERPDDVEGAILAKIHRGEVGACPVSDPAEPTTGNRLDPRSRRDPDRAGLVTLHRCNDRIDDCRIQGLSAGEVTGMNVEGTRASRRTRSGILCQFLQGDRNRTVLGLGVRTIESRLQQHRSNLPLTRPGTGISDRILSWTGQVPRVVDTLAT